MIKQKPLPMSDMHNPWNHLRKYWSCVLPFIMIIPAFLSHCPHFQIILHISSSFLIDSFFLSFYKAHLILCHRWVTEFTCGKLVKYHMSGYDCRCSAFCTCKSGDNFSILDFQQAQMTAEQRPIIYWISPQVSGVIRKPDITWWTSVNHRGTTDQPTYTLVACKCPPLGFPGWLHCHVKLALVQWYW